MIPAPCEFPHLVAYEQGYGIPTDPPLDAFCEGYATALLWAEAYRWVPSLNEFGSDDMSLESDTDATYSYISPGRWWEGMGIDFTDAVAFLADNFTMLESLNVEWGQHGHDFLLTRNHHGAGFWDRDYPDDVASALTATAQAYGEHSVLTDDSPRVVTL